MITCRARWLTGIGSSGSNGASSRSTVKEGRHQRSRLSAQALVEKAALRHGISAVEATTTLWTLTVPERRRSGIPQQPAV